MNGNRRGAESPERSIRTRIEADEIAVWKPEAENVISLLQAIGTSAESDVIPYLARRELRSVHLDHWPEIAPAGQHVLNDIAPVAESGCTTC